MLAQLEAGSAVCTAYLGLGSNRGERAAHLRGAVEALAASAGLRGIEASPVYESEAHTLRPDEEQPPFLNAVLAVEGVRSPEGLLETAHALEHRAGRRRDADRRWQPRPLDVDLLAVGRLTRQTDRLTLPHPRLAERRFVLRPWADLAPDFVVPPPFGATVRALLAACPDETALRRTEIRLTAPGSDPDPAGDAPEPG